MNLKQTMFVKYYTEGDTKGNCEQSMLKAGYKSQYARGHCGTFIVASSCVKKAIEDAVKEVKEWMEGGKELLDRLFEERYRACVSKKDNTNAIRCLENKAKNVGYYAADNAQRTEQVKLDEAEAKEARKIANILNLEDAKKGKVG
jgi:hypothetical protein